LTPDLFANEVLTEDGDIDPDEGNAVREKFLRFIELPFFLPRYGKTQKNIYNVDTAATPSRQNHCGRRTSPA
jgi:hypothetical protein